MSGFAHRRDVIANLLVVADRTCANDHLPARGASRPVGVRVKSDSQKNIETS